VPQDPMSAKGSIAKQLLRNGHGDWIPREAMYHVYIGSDRWAERRAAYFSVHGQQCAACGATEEIQLHHRSYERFTKEQDEDLRALCVTCHTWVHYLERSSSIPLAEATDRVISGVARGNVGASSGTAVPVFVKTRGRANIDDVFDAVRKRQGGGSTKSNSSRSARAASARAAQGDVLPNTPGYPEAAKGQTFRPGQRTIIRRASCKHRWSPWGSGMLNSTEFRTCSRCGAVRTRKKPGTGEGGGGVSHRPH